MLENLYIQGILTKELFEEMVKPLRYEFLFVSNIPPDQWRNYVNNKLKYLSDCLGGNQMADQNIINCMINSFNILILSEKIIGG
ncbi:MAG: hypothetical protein GY795_23850 [Desulfobacterales bacterium]|nr:hypothetical protein [Desulfobacterales bacterium]